MTLPPHPVIRALTFIDVMDDVASRLSWTKLGVALSTVFTAVTGAGTAVQAVVGDVAHTEWQGFAAAIGFHAITKSAREIKRMTEKAP